MDEKKAKELTDSIFDKLNDQERVYLAWVHNQKNKEIQELKKENEFLKLSNPEMNIEHFRYVKENKRKIDNLRLVNKRLNNKLKDIKSQLDYLETYSSKEDVFEDMKRRLDRIDKIIGSDINETNK